MNAPCSGWEAPWGPPGVGQGKPFPPCRCLGGPEETCYRASPPEGQGCVWARPRPSQTLTDAGPAQLRRLHGAPPSSSAASGSFPFGSKGFRGDALDSRSGARVAHMHVFLPPCSCGGHPPAASLPTTPPSRPPSHAASGLQHFSVLHVISLRRDFVFSGWILLQTRLRSGCTSAPSPTWLWKHFSSWCFISSCCVCHPHTQ